ncbi:Fip1 motif-domain-containing protein [Annulohypoxylon maeteangense]|uniref:Fip1 motif-domain-containing protein n=1 Tax=Annulohypoxylon maeteangense TaxID=1927788 RepID=UPI0020078C0C|nr:Fip1 motif-domain-containing protein [Annulohypoxylon maeteangense]KAI0889495.1 Fip1 motif-domain-containing protein [Annulohypoxylon maeteangense]
MDIDDDDDFYAPDEPTTHDDHHNPTATNVATLPIQLQTQQQQQEQENRNEEDLEEGEEEDEGADMDEDDSDVDIITERKDGINAPPPAQSRYSDIRNIPQRSASSDATAKPTAIKKESASTQPTLGPDLPAVSTSKVDVNAIPVYKPVGKPITQVSIDEDLAENDKPWRKPGTDLSDYFNYGFDEFTWSLYAAKQDNVRNEYSSDVIAQNNKKMLEDIQMMMMGGMPGMNGTGASGGMANMPGMDGVSPEMQAMMQQMMASGLDPSQMDPSAMSAMFSGMQNSGGNAASGQGNQNQNFSGVSQGFSGNQGQNFGYEQNLGRGGGGGGGGGTGSFSGRGRGGRRNW